MRFKSFPVCEISLQQSTSSDTELENQPLIDSCTINWLSMKNNAVINIGEVAPLIMAQSWPCGIQIASEYLTQN